MNMTPEKFAKMALTVPKIGRTRWSPFRLGKSGRLLTSWCFGHNDAIGQKMAPHRSRHDHIDIAHDYYLEHRKQVNAHAKRMLQEGIHKGVEVIP
jgi:hypothetical protein